jgi:uncharacterized protein (TIGR02391 family)
MHWDDIQLLKMIDHLEEVEPGSLSNGLFLMQRVADGQPLDHNRDYGTFAWELLVAARAGFVVWDGSGVYRPNADPLSDANNWIQQIRDLRLTAAGRDRARGRLFLQPEPDPGEDDGRQIVGLTLEEIALALSEVLLPTQVQRYLLDTGLPEEYLSFSDGDDKRKYFLSVFERLLSGGSAARRALRTFIGSWLANRQSVGPRPDIQRRIVGQLARQGWFVKDDRLVIGTPEFSDAPLATPLGREARLAALHSSVRRVADRYIDDGHMGVAVFEAFKAVNNRVKDMIGSDADGESLMGNAFGGSAPVLRLADLATTSGLDEQAGFRDIFRGSLRGIRNPNAHEPFATLDDNEAIEELTLASLLMHRLDRATKPE